jgi:hypothetical protein
VGANDKLGQDLSWDRETQTLTAHVTYSLISGGGYDNVDPSDCETFDLPFPSVSVDRKNNLYILSKNEKIMLGHLKNGIFGPNVVLNDNVQLVAHRYSGKLLAKLVVGAR